MSSKISVRHVVTDHFDTFTDTRTARAKLGDFVLMIGAPAAAATMATLVGIQVQDGGQLVAGAAILAAFSFALAIFVFELRMSASRDPRIERGARIFDLLDELFANVSYSIVVGLALTVSAVVGSSTAPTWWSIPAWLEAVGSGFLLALGAHYVLTILMILKRMRAAYRQLTT